MYLPGTAAMLPHFSPSRVEQELAMRSALLALICLIAFTAPSFAQDTIEPGSVVNITILGSPQLSQTVTVEDDGTTDYPLLGSFRIEGMTAEELSSLLSEVVSRFMDRPRVFVTLSGYELVAVRVTGAVLNPGEVVLKAPADLMDAVAAAGGTIAEADLQHVVIVRNPGDGESGRETVDLRDYSKVHSTVRERVILEIGDMVLIPTLKQSSYVRVLGFVRAPGPYIADKGATLIDAIYLAGGFDNQADRGDITLIRPTPAGADETNYDFTDLMNRAVEIPLIEAGDIIVVGKREFYEDPNWWVDWIRNAAMLISSYVLLQRL